MKSNVVRIFYVKACYLMFLHFLESRLKEDSEINVAGKQPANLICSLLLDEYTDL
jgi:hypothetical protein